MITNGTHNLETKVSIPFPLIFSSKKKDGFNPLKCNIDPVLVCMITIRMRAEAQFYKNKVSTLPARFTRKCLNSLKSK